MNNLGPLLFLAFLVGLLVWRVLHRPPSLKQHFENWARWNGVNVTMAQRRYLFVGPFKWRRSGIAYRIRVQENGRARSGWVRFGYDFFGTQPWASSAVWDDEPHDVPNESSDPTLSSVTPPGEAAHQ
jgi:hypothetical protein